MRRLELSWLRVRLVELQRERRTLHAQILRTRSLNAQLQQLLGEYLITRLTGMATYMSQVFRVKSPFA